MSGSSLKQIDDSICKFYCRQRLGVGALREAMDVNAFIIRAAHVLVASFFGRGVNIMLEMMSVFQNLV